LTSGCRGSPQPFIVTQHGTASGSTGELMSTRPGDYVPQAAQYILGYGFYACLLVVTFFTFWLWRETLLLWLARAFANAAPDTRVYVRALYYAINLALGVAALTFAVGSEAYIRAGIERQPLRAHVTRLAVVLVVATLLGLAVQVAVQEL